MSNTFLHISDQQLLKINVSEICHSGWIQNVKGYRLELQHRPQGICLFVNGELTTQVWQVSEVEVPYLEMNNGEPWPDGSQYAYYVIGADGKRYRHLYICGTKIGTRTDFGLKYRSPYRSKRHRWYEHSLKSIRLGTRKRRRWMERRERARLRACASWKTR
jgi:hypothetical protein